MLFLNIMPERGDVNMVKTNLSLIEVVSDASKRGLVLTITRTSKEKWTATIFGGFEPITVTADTIHGLWPEIMYVTAKRTAHMN